MTGPRSAVPFATPHAIDKAVTLALSLAQAEEAIHDFAAGQVDAVTDAEGRTYLLRPAQENLRQDERRWRAIIESVGVGITVVNRGGKVVSQNRAAARILGYAPNELVGLSFFEVVDAVDLHPFHSAFFNVIEEFRPEAVIKIRLRAHDGTFRELETVVNKLQTISAVCVVLTFREVIGLPAVADRAQARKLALPVATLDRDRILATLSHELRTPLMPILFGIAELQQNEQTAEAQTTLEMMRRKLAIQSQLLDELVDFTTLGQHKMRLHPTLVDMHEAIGFVLEICRLEIAASRASVVLALQATQSIIFADSVRLQQVLWNLVKNAVKFSPADSQISIKTFNPTAHLLTIEVSDAGQGIEPALLPLVFEAFFQGGFEGQWQQDGLGLGLFIAKGIATAHGGTLTAMSEGPGKGATFRLTVASTPGAGPQVP